WTDSMWQNVIFSDEMNVEVDSRKGRCMLRRKPNERFHESCVVKRTKQGSGSVGIWACMTAKGVGFFTLYDGRLNAELYYDILNNFLLPSIDLFQEDQPLTFQQDGAPCHTARLIKGWFEEHNIQTLIWPP